MFLHPLHPHLNFSAMLEPPAAKRVPLRVPCQVLNFGHIGRALTYVLCGCACTLCSCCVHSCAGTV